MLWSLPISSFLSKPHYVCMKTGKLFKIMFGLEVAVLVVSVIIIVSFTPEELTEDPIFDRIFIVLVAIGLTAGVYFIIVIRSGKG